MTIKERNKLKNSLPKGYRGLLAEKLNCSLSLIDQVLADKKDNIEVLHAAVVLAESYKSKVEELSNKIKSL